MENKRKMLLVTLGPAYIGVGVLWLTLVLYVVIGGVIVRQTTAGSLAQWMDRLPPPIAKLAFVLCWCVFFLGWIVPLAVGLRHVFDHARENVRH